MLSIVTFLKTPEAYSSAKFLGGVFCTINRCLWAFFCSVIRDSGQICYIWEHFQNSFCLKALYPDFKLFALIFHQRANKVQRVNENHSILRGWDLNASIEGPAWKLNNLLPTDGLSCDRWNKWIKEDGKIKKGASSLKLIVRHMEHFSLHCSQMY